jgi:Domain of unknown function DUF11
MTAARRRATSTLLADGRVLIAGGFDSGTNQYLAGTEIYDPASGSFSNGGALKTARGLATATLLPSGKVLIAAGAGNSGPLSSVELYDPVSGTSVFTGAMASPRSSAIATLLPVGKVLISGGIGVGSNNVLAAAELYDPGTASFSTAGMMVVGHTQATAVLLPAGQVLVMGGLQKSGGSTVPGRNAERYDAAAASFETTGSMIYNHAGYNATLLPNGQVFMADVPYERYDPVSGTFNAVVSSFQHLDPTATALVSGQVLIVGAVGVVGAEKHCDLYDPATGSIIGLVGQLSVSRYAHTAALLASGKVLVAGGTDFSSAGFPLLASAEIYDPATLAFSTTNPMNVAHYQAVATLLPNGKVLVAGGNSDINGATPITTAELYDPATGTFALTGAMTSGHHSATATLLPNGKVLIAGGHTTGEQPVAELYDPAVGTFATTGAMASARYNATATLLPNGKVLVAGGHNYFSGTLASAELYDPATGVFSAAGSMTVARESAAAALLNNGRVLIAGGDIDGHYSYTNSAELYDSGLGFIDARRPTLYSIALSAPTAPTALQISGSGFLASAGQATGAIVGSEGSSGSVESSASNYPLLQLQRMDNGQQFFVNSDASTNWTDSDFASLGLSNLPLGLYRATLFVSAIPSMSRLFAVGPASAMVPGVGAQQAQVTTAFPQPLQVHVNDANGNPIQGVSVAFAAMPGTNGASATLSAGSALSNAQGMAFVTATANSIAGGHAVRATLNAGVTVNFTLTNLPGPAAHILGIAGNSQSTQVNTSFPVSLQVMVSDLYNNPVGGAIVTFATPASGAGAILSVPAPTNGSGMTSVMATANLIAGSYLVSASVNSVSTGASFALSNLRGPAALLAANNGPDFSGTAGLPMAVAPAVVVTDSFGNAVPGIAVDFVVGAGSGSITGDSASTDVSGIASVGGWTQGADPGANTLQASAAGLGGSPITFTAMGIQVPDVAVQLTNNRYYVQFGHTLDDVIVITVAGPSNAVGILVTDMLPPPLDAANAHWICVPAVGSSCNPSGQGNLVDESVNIATGSSVTFVLSVTVLSDPAIGVDLFTHTVSTRTVGDTNAANDSATVTNQAVIFRNGFEPGGDCSQ